MSLAYSKIRFGKYAKVFPCGMPAGYKAQHSHCDAPISCIYGESLSIFPVNDSATQEMGVTTCCVFDLPNGIWQKPFLCNIFG